MAAFVAGMMYQNNLNRNDLNSLQWYKQTYRSKEGFSQKFGEYQLHTIDGGLNWYAVRYTDKGIRILGHVDKVYPGLSSYLKAIDTIHRHAKNPGSVSEKELQEAGLKLKQPN
ncbi:MAG: hypothetical protein QXR60_02700 [Candidatus Nanoarchaeia archaeon]